MRGKCSGRAQKWTFSPTLLQNKELSLVQNLQRGWKPEKQDGAQALFVSSLICLLASAGPSASVTSSSRGWARSETFKLCFMKFLGKRLLSLGQHKESPKKCVHNPYS